MDILLIAPCDHSQVWKGRRSLFVFPSLALPILGALTPSRHRVRILDEALDDVSFAPRPDLVGITVMTPNAPRAYAIADRFRALGTKVVLGGIHIAACPDEAALHADALVLGEAELLWPRLLDDAERGELLPVYRNEERLDMALVPMPRRDLLPLHRYRFPYTVMASRGCPYRCSFCSTTQYFGFKYRTRPVDAVIEEITSFPSRFFMFLDDHLFAMRPWAKELMKQLAPLGKKWGCMTTLAISKDEELMELAAAAGCIGVLVGFETVSDANLRDIRKHQKVKDYRGVIQGLHRHGIMVQGSFVLGFDHDDTNAFDKTIAFAHEIGVDFGNFCTLTPLPGTDQYAQIQTEGRIVESDWSRYNRWHVAYHPKQMSRLELLTGRERTYRAFYSWPSILRRLPWRWPHAFYFAIYSLAYRRGMINEARAVREMGIFEQYVQEASGGGPSTTDQEAKPVPAMQML
ncbi:MAG: radical SAM protein [Candidatus Schekmanbacteria bacterium]|nr:radical SAM protein [Candidatus Schekmanbacteria bacterium]